MRSRVRVLAVLSLLAALAAAAGCRGSEDDARSGRGGRGGQAGAARATPVAVAEVTRGRLVAHLSYPGELQSDAVELAAKIAGQLLEVRVRIGDQVRAGALLARIDDRELQRRRKETVAQLQLAQASGRRARVQQQLAERKLQRTAPLLARKLVSRQEVDDLRTAVASLGAEVAVAEAQVAQADARLALLKHQIADARMVAPFDAVVAERRLDSGAFVQVGAPVLRLVQAGTLRVAFRVPERDLQDLKVGQAFEVATQATGDERFAGRVTRLAGEVSRTDRSLAVEGRLDQPTERLRPGMFAEIRVVKGVIDPATIVPGIAVVTRTDASGVELVGVLVAEGDRAVWRAVRVVGREGDRAAVDGELSPGERVLTLGHSDLADGARIVVAGGQAGRDGRGGDHAGRKARAGDRGPRPAGADSPGGRSR